jgi:hypothetical protein
MGENNPVGRPPIIDDGVLNKLEQAFSLGATDLEACFYAGISHQTLYNYQNKYPEFVERKEALKDKLILKSRMVVSDALDNGDKQTAQWYLERKKKDEFSPKHETAVSGAIDLNVNDVTDKILAAVPQEVLEASLVENKNNH